MAFGVFIRRRDSIYDDSPAERYQFPRQYLARVQACVGDWIIYYEPRKVAGTRGYFAAAKVRQVIPDPAAPDMHIAIIEPGSYLDFANPVAFTDARGVIERGVLNEEGRISGRAQAAVRPLSPADFNRIISLGLDDQAWLLPRLDGNAPSDGFAEEQAPFVFEQERERAGFLALRIVRDRVFRRVVLRAYDERCAMTGLKLINGGGRAEVAAAHIRPVEANGPDIVSNGIALSGTAHVWTPPRAQEQSRDSRSRDRVLPCVRPLMRRVCAAGPYGSARIETTSLERARSARRAPGSLDPALPTLRHTYPSTFTPPTASHPSIA